MKGIIKKIYVNAYVSNIYKRSTARFQIYTEMSQYKLYSREGRGWPALDMVPDDTFISPDGSIIVFTDHSTTKVHAQDIEIVPVANIPPLPSTLGWGAFP